MNIYDLLNTKSVNSISDWAEFYTAFSKEEFSKAQLKSFIEESTGSEPKYEEIDDIWFELKCRETLYGDDPPFKVKSDLLVHNFEWESIPEYMACLIFSLLGNQTEKVYSGTLFEKITNEAIRNYIGGKSIVFGAPNELKVIDIAKEINEKFVSEFPSHRKDRGLDIVAWKPFDNRASQLILFIQCAAGHNWKQKTGDLKLDAWTTYINFACKPLKGLSIPVIITDKEDMREKSYEAGIIIDRSRIYKYTLIGDRNTVLKAEVKAWCDKRIAED